MLRRPDRHRDDRGRTDRLVALFRRLEADGLEDAGTGLVQARVTGGFHERDFDRPALRVDGNAELRRPDRNGVGRVAVAERAFDFLRARRDAQVGDLFHALDHERDRHFDFRRHGHAVAGAGLERQRLYDASRRLLLPGLDAGRQACDGRAAVRRDVHARDNAAHLAGPTGKARIAPGDLIRDGLRTRLQPGRLDLSRLNGRLRGRPGLALATSHR